jgi:hypothetical protein
MVCYFSNMECPVRITYAVCRQGLSSSLCPYLLSINGPKKLSCTGAPKFCILYPIFFSLEFYCEIAAHLAAATYHPVPRSARPVLQEKGDPAAPMNQQLNKQRVLRKDLGSRRTASSTISLHPGPNAASARVLQSTR